VFFVPPVSPFFSFFWLSRTGILSFPPLLRIEKEFHIQTSLLSGLRFLFPPSFSLVCTPAFSLFGPLLLVTNVVFLPFPLGKIRIVERYMLSLAPPPFLFLPGIKSIKSPGAFFLFFFSCLHVEKRRSLPSHSGFPTFSFPYRKQLAKYL